MKVNQKRLALLVAGISAATTIAACVTEEEPTASQVGESTECMNNPGEGSQNAPLYSFEEGTCFDIARFAPAPNVEGCPAIDGINSSYEGAAIDFDDYLYDHCRAYSSQLRPAVAKKVEECLLEANDKRELNEFSDPIGRFDWMDMYGCGIETLRSICGDEATIDNRSDGRCERIANLSSQPYEQTFKDCQKVLTGLRGSARQQIEKCMQEGADYGYELHNCVEGLVDDASDNYDSEPEDECVPLGGIVPDEPASCDPILQKHAQEGGGVDEFIAQKCQSYREMFSDIAAEATLACLLDPDKTVWDSIYSCGAEGLRAVCRSEDVHPQCQDLVDAINAAAEAAGQGEKPNAGGRITKQCRALMPGLTSEARVKVADCVPGQAESFAQWSMAQYTFYSCVEGL